MNVRQGYFYTKEHEWIKIEGKIVKVGITDYAQHKLGDLTYVELPQIGKVIKQGEVLNGLESVKAASDVYSPVSGKVINANAALENDPGLINKSPYDDGWIVEIEIQNEDEIKNLMNADEYLNFLGQSK